MDFDKTQVMKQYGILSINKLEDAHVKSLTEQVKKEVKAAQDAADQVVNLLTPGKKKDGSTPEPDFAGARVALGKLAKVAPNLLAHWSPFVRAVLEALPPPADGEKLDATDDSEMLGEIERQVQKIGLSFAIAPTGALRVLDSSLGKLSADLRDEMEKRGMPVVDIAKLRADVGGGEIGEAGVPATEQELRGVIADLKAEVASTQKTRDEMAAAADRLEKELANERSISEANADALRKLQGEAAEANKLLEEGAEQLNKSTQANQALKKRSAELEHELEALKKKSKSK